jgi:hypothetical protein
MAAQVLPQIKQMVMNAAVWRRVMSGGYSTAQAAMERPRDVRGLHDTTVDETSMASVN